MKKIIGIIVILASVISAGVAVATNLSSKSYVSSNGYTEDIASAMSGYAANNVYADSAPKQQVVNGWVAKDLLKVSTEQNAEIIYNQASLGAIAKDTNMYLMFLSILMALLVISNVLPNLSSREENFSPTQPEPTDGVE